MFAAFSSRHGAALESLLPGAAVCVAEPLHRLLLPDGQMALLCTHVMPDASQIRSGMQAR